MINSIIVYTIFVFLLPKILWISYMIGVFMEHPRLLYVLNTYHRRCNSDMIILMLPTTDTLHWTTLQHMMQRKCRSDIINKISNHKKLTRFHSIVIIFCDQVRYFVEMAISRVDLGNSWPGSQAWSMAKVMHETNQPIYSHSICFVQIRPLVLKT